MIEINWNDYARGSSEVIPDSLSMHIVNPKVAVTICEETPYLVHSIRYRTTEDVQFFFKVNGREYGDWKLYQPFGVIVVSPRLMLLGKDVFMYFRNMNTALDLSLDVERIRSL